ncbi:hypothetical protein NK8_71630 (plasmid) [Caballeronia sp. NK8]|nr:hypothetical protein NK8_71630 [Caballeronia sp. NK8]
MIRLRNEFGNGFALGRPCDGGRIHTFGNGSLYKFVLDAHRYGLDVEGLPRRDTLRDSVEERSNAGIVRACKDAHLGENVRIKAVGQERDRIAQTKMLQRDAQIEERRAATDDELSIERIDNGQRPRAIGT